MDTDLFSRGRPSPVARGADFLYTGDMGKSWMSVYENFLTPEKIVNELLIAIHW